MRQRSIAILATAACACAALALVAYWPGLHGSFLFDDFANLPALGNSGPIDNWPAFWRYITSGFNDPFGRPLTLLSFLLDGHDWPADPFPFKRTSLILHLVNGALLALLLARLGHALHADTTRGRGPTPGAGDAASRRADPGTVPASPHGTVAAVADDAALAWRIDLAALLGAALWLLHPLFVSTTLYIVQREAMLPATFILLGLMAWLHGRERLRDGHLCGGLLWVCVGLGGGTLLAVLAKANGALLPLYALAIECTVLTRQPFAASATNRHSRESGTKASNTSVEQPKADPEGMSAANNPVPLSGSVEEPRHWMTRHSSVESPTFAGMTRGWMAQDAPKRAYRLAMWVLAVIPSLAILAYVLWTAVRGIISGDMGIRSWTIGQRLLTEPRVLWDYLSLLWLPRPFSHGLFNDQFVASTSLWHPAITLPALLGVLALSAGAWWLRRRYPALALAVLFYFAGQLIESSSLPLELYFEHRNYVPALLMFWPLALWLADTRQLPRLKLALMLVLPLGLAVMTYARAGLWGNPQAQSMLWAQINPQSPRAQANAAQIEIAAGQPQAALRRLQPLLAADPAQAQLAFNWIDARCALGEVSPTDIAATREAMRTTANPGTLLTTWFARKLPEVAAGRCRGLTLTDLGGWIDAGMDNPRLAGAGRRQDLWYARGQLALLQHQPDTALADFSRALDLNVRAAMALQGAATLGAAGYPAQGLQLLDRYAQARKAAPAPGFGMPRLHAWVLARQNYWPHEIAHLRRQLELDAASVKSNTVPSIPDAGPIR